jgi:hypothetical protein
MTYRNLEDISFCQSVRKWAIGGFNAKMNLPANVFQARVAHQCAREQPGFGKNLEAVANAENQTAAGSEALNCLHDWRKAGNRPSPQVVAVGKPSRNQHCVDAAQIFRVVPQKRHGLVSYFGNHIKGVVVAVGTRKDEYSKPHASRVSVSERNGRIFLKALVTSMCTAVMPPPFFARQGLPFRIDSG